MDANYILAWIAGLSALVWGVRWFQAFGWRQPGWLAVAGLVLASLGVGLLVAPRAAGYVSGSLWAVLMLLPMLGNRYVLLMMARQRFTLAARLSQVVAFLHPSRAWRQRSKNLMAMELMRRGQVSRADRVLESLADDTSLFGRHARLQQFRLHRDWAGLVAWFDAEPARRALLMREASAVSLYLRALGERGDVGRMVRTFGVLPTGLRAAWGELSKRILQLVPLALAGRVEAARTLVTGPLAHLGHDVGRFWVGTALQRAGRPDEAADVLRPLPDQTGDRLLADFVRDRLASPLASVESLGLEPDVTAALDALAVQAGEADAVRSLIRPTAPGPAWVTLAITAILVAVYLLELPGGATNIDNLTRLGALIGPPALTGGQYWRVFTAGLLHFGLIHLLLNLVGVWYFGRFLERLIGPWRFLVCYVLSGPGAFALILAYSAFFGGETFLLVGASASLMGIVGAAAAVLYKRWRRGRSPRVRRQLGLLVLIVALQTVFDLVTPQVSFAAHFGGAVIGLLLGAVIGLERPPVSPIATTSPATRSST